MNATRSFPPLLPADGFRRILRRILRPVLAAAFGLAFVACEGTLLVQPQDVPPASIVVTYDLGITPGSDGAARAFDRVDGVRIRLSQNGAVKIDTVLAFRGDAAGGSAALALPVDGQETSFQADLDLLLDRAPLFRGNAPFSVGPGQVRTVDVSLAPVPAGVQVPEGVPTLRALNDSVPLAAAVVFASGDTIPGLTPRWTSLDPGVVEVVAGGWLVARGEGSTVVLAQLLEFAEPLSVQVRPEVATVVVTPSTVELSVRESTLLRAEILDPKGNPLSNRPVSWSSSDPDVAPVDGDGIVVGLTPGIATLVATVEGRSGSAQVSVVPRSVVDVRLIPSSLSLVPGQSGRLTLSALNAEGQAIPVSGAVWSSSDPTVASISESGEVTPLAPGSTTITAQVGGTSASSVVTVSARVVYSISVAPGSVELAPRGVARLSATLRNANGDPVTGPPVEWRSSNSRVATVSSAGLVTGRAVGEATIVAMSQGLEDRAMVRVEGSDDGGDDGSNGGGGGGGDSGGGGGDSGGNGGNGGGGDSGGGGGDGGNGGGGDSGGGGDDGGNGGGGDSGGGGGDGGNGGGGDSRRGRGRRQRWGRRRRGR
jgi:uncharacterized protein YjdB